MRTAPIFRASVSERMRNNGSLASRRCRALTGSSANARGRLGIASGYAPFEWRVVPRKRA